MEYGAIGRGQGTGHSSVCGPAWPPWHSPRPHALPAGRTGPAGRETTPLPAGPPAASGPQTGPALRMQSPHMWRLSPGPVIIPCTRPQPQNTRPPERVQTQQPPRTNMQSPVLVTRAEGRGRTAPPEAPPRRTPGFAPGTPGRSQDTTSARRRLC